jgi:outer membrane protein
MNKKFNSFVIILIVALISVNLYTHFTKPKLALIEIQKVYDAFDLKKELETKFKSVQNQRKKVLDSLELELKLMYASFDKDIKKDDPRVTTFNVKKNYFIQKQQLTQEDDQALSQQYDKEILLQLSQYVKDFGKEKGYTYIFGTDGNGSVMYAHESVDISVDVISYINNKYKGLK